MAQFTRTERSERPISNKEISSDKGQSDALRELGDKLDSIQNSRQPIPENDASAWAIGVNYASAFIGAVVVAGGIGFCVDYFANTKPWGIMVGVVLGFMAGTRSIVLMAKEMNEE